MTEGDQTVRRLAAILAADVVGYSRMMAADELGTLSALKHHRETIFDPIVARHRGRVVKLIGDGALVEFASVIDAVSCAIAIQHASVAAAPDDKGIVLRIGINLGDVIVDGDDVYGDGVNIAARLEPLAEPGGICISSIVNDSVGNRVDATFRDCGEVAVKNIPRAIRVWRWHPAESSSKQVPDAPRLAPRDGAAVAVLPFSNLSGDVEQEYFSDGVAEDIITDLSKIGALMVISRNSSFAYKGKNVDTRSVGRDLGVQAVLEGSIRRSGNRIRITAQLIDTATGGHLWADRYDRDLTDIFAVQDEVTHAIVNALKVQLTPGEKARIAKAGTNNLEAHELLLRARSFVFSPNIDGESCARAAELLTQAVELDPAFAEAYALLATASVLDFHNGWSTSRESALKRADEFAAKAIAADPNDASGYAIAAVPAQFLKDFRRAKSVIARALQLSPSHAFAYNSRATLAIYTGHPQEAIPDIEQAMRLDPGWSHQYLYFLGFAHLMMGNYETAATMLRERVLLAPNTDVGRSALASALGHLGEVDEARQVWAELKEINPRYSFEDHLARLPFSDPHEADKIRQGLIKAGLLNEDSAS